MPIAVWAPAAIWNEVIADDSRGANRFGSHVLDAGKLKVERHLGGLEIVLGYVSCTFESFRV
jgi:hypothetical protein